MFANASDSDVTQTTQRNALIEAVRNYEQSSAIPLDTTTDAVERVVATARAGQNRDEASTAINSPPAVAATRVRAEISNVIPTPDSRKSRLEGMTSQRNR